jgi:hypothetical protein
MGTTSAFFDRYRYRGDRALEFAAGHGLEDLYDAVIGADVAGTLGYSVGDPIVVAHGLASFTEHEDQPFRVAGIVAKTRTPVDRTVIVSVEAIEAIHVDWRRGRRSPARRRRSTRSGRWTLRRPRSRRRWMSSSLSRRSVLAGLGAATTAGLPLHAEEI